LLSSLADLPSSPADVSLNEIAQALLRSLSDSFYVGHRAKCETQRIFLCQLGSGARATPSAEGAERVVAKLRNFQSCPRVLGLC
jgi:hypothetical protein